VEQLFVGGEQVASRSSETIPVENPATEEIIAEVPDASAEDIDRVVEVARRAQRSWRKVDGLTRAELLHECADRLLREAPNLARSLTREQGKPLKESLDEIEWSATAFRHLGEVARASGGRVVAPTKSGQMNLVLQEPVGTVVHIFPSNYPIVLLAWQCAAALAVGNACIVKPSELTPLTTLELGPLFDHLPAGIFNIVTATGAGSAQLVGHEGTDMIAFTGSVATGRRIMGGAAPRIKKLLLELGGNNPYIVLADSKLDPASRGAVFSAFLNAGQVCTAASRFYVEETVFDEFMEHAVSQTQALRIGDPMEDVDVGPMVARPLTENIDRALEEFADKGAYVRTGGGRPDNLPKGHFYQPTIVELTDPRRQEPEEEIFGPLATFTPVRDLDEAIELANDTHYGLGANIYTSSLETAMRAATELEAGTVWINDPLKDNDAAPFGGQKMSGVGRELGSEGVSAFTETKHVHIDFAQQPQPEWWFPYERPELQDRPNLYERPNL